MQDIIRGNRQFSELPVSAVLPELKKALGKGHAVLSAPTGSGKTTLAPLALLALPHFSSAGIIMLEPRRIAARAAASRMSDMLGEPVGGTIGYRTRFDSKVSHKTRLEIVTEGVLLRKIQSDPELGGTSLVIFDEYHERSMQADLGLALCLDLCELREDLRLLVMSATLDAEPICALLGGVPHIRASGRSYPVETINLPPRKSNTSIARQVYHGVLQAFSQTDGDILAFLPGAGEIKRCREMLEEELADAVILPLYGSLSHKEQDKVFARCCSHRRIILATPIAETSITIDNIGCVVDSGYHRQPVYDHASGMTRLRTARISRASAAQRTGRAGRTGPGHCYRLWDMTVEHSMLDHTPPEIITTELSPLVLELALWGVHDPAQLRWLDRPRASAWSKAVALLQRLEFLDEGGTITATGKQAAALPLHPRLAALLLRAKKAGHPWTGCLLAATLTDRDILHGEGSPVDISLRVKILTQITDRTAALHHRVDRQLCQRLLRQAEQWFGMLHCSQEKGVNFESLGNLLAFGYPDRIAALRNGSGHRYQLANGRGAELPPGDSLRNSPLLAVAGIDARQGDGRIFLATPLAESDLHDSHSQLLHERKNIYWDQAREKVQAVVELCLDSITLQSRPQQDPDQHLVSEAFLEGVRQSGLEVLPWDRESRLLFARINSLGSWQPGDWSDFNEEKLAADLTWLAPYCSRMRSLSQLRELSMKNILLGLLGWEQQQLLEQLAPTHLQVPSGSRIRLKYVPGEPPVLAVRLQELFGLTETPMICRDRIPVLLHLLSPAGRPMQVTSDLNSFWRNTYPEVRKELAGRYPKHYWPKDPFTAEATAKTKKQMQRQKN